MKLMGIDYGAKRVGVALSDDGGEMAFAKVVLPGGGSLVQSIVDICTAEGVVAIVIGDSRDYAWNENPIMKEVHRFVQDLKKKTPLPIYFEPELMTSMEAEHLQGHSDMHDASAAALILKSYIDRLRNSKIENRMTSKEVKGLAHEIRNSEFENRASEKQAQNTKTAVDKLKREEDESRQEENVNN